MKNNNPVFFFIEEGINVNWIMGNMGFEVAYDAHEAWDEAFPEYTDNDILEWTPEPPDGFTLVATYDTENGPVAMFVKPKTPFAERLLAFGIIESWHEPHKNGRDLSAALETATAVLNARLVDLTARLRDLGRDRHDAPAEVLAAIDEHRQQVQAEFDRAKHASAIIGSDALLRIIAPRGGLCEWRENSDGDWETACGHTWCLIDGTPSDNDMRFCPVCGGVLREVADAADAEEHEDDDDE